MPMETSNLCKARCCRVGLFTPGKALSRYNTKKAHTGIYLHSSEMSIYIHTTCYMTPRKTWFVCLWNFNGFLQFSLGNKMMMQRREGNLRQASESWQLCLLGVCNHWPWRTTTSLNELSSAFLKFVMNWVRNFSSSYTFSTTNRSST
jgi:hypothetical protein